MGSISFKMTFFPNSLAGFKNYANPASKTIQTQYSWKESYWFPFLVLLI